MIRFDQCAQIDRAIPIIYATETFIWAWVVEKKNNTEIKTPNKCTNLH